MKIASTLSFALVSALLLVACGPKQPPPTQAPFTGTMPEPTEVHIEGDHVTLDRHINFETDSARILGDSSNLLDQIAGLLQRHPELQHLRIIGHTDAEGGHEHNQDLSERRAVAVVAALRERGITIELEASGVGELERVCEDDTDACHARNRRVEFLIVR